MAVFISPGTACPIPVRWTTQFLSTKSKKLTGSAMGQHGFSIMMKHGRTMASRLQFLAAYSGSARQGELPSEGVLNDTSFPHRKAVHRGHTMTIRKILLAAVALCALSTTAISSEVTKIGNWSFSSGKISLDLEGGPPPVYGSLISLSNADADLLQISCSDKKYTLSLMYGADTPPSGTMKIRIDVDNNDVMDAIAKVENYSVSSHILVLTHGIGDNGLLILSRTRTALKVTPTGGHPLRFMASGTREAIIALHDAC
jgi:hypothetical protein